MSSLRCFTTLIVVPISSTRDRIEMIKGFVEGMNYFVLLVAIVVALIALPLVNGVLDKEMTWAAAVVALGGVLIFFAWLAFLGWLIRSVYNWIRSFF